MKWTNTKEALPDEGKYTLIKEIQDDFTSYHVSKRLGECFSAYGCKWLCVSRSREVFWVYISEVENNMESSYES